MKRAATMGALLVFAMATNAATPAAGETMLRLDEVAPGEIDPGKSTKSIDSVLLYNIYDMLLMPGAGGAGFFSHAAARAVGHLPRRMRRAGAPRGVSGESCPCGASRPLAIPIRAGSARLGAARKSRSAGPYFEQARPAALDRQGG